MLQIYENRHNRAHLEFISKGLTTINKLTFTLFAAARCCWYFESLPHLACRREILENLFVFGFNTRLAQDRISEMLNSNRGFTDIIPCINISTRCLLEVTDLINLHHREDLPLNSLYLDLRLLHDSAKVSFSQLSFARGEMITSELMLEMVMNQYSGTTPMELEQTNDRSEDLSNAIRANSQRVRQNMQSLYGRL